MRRPALVAVATTAVIVPALAALAAPKQQSRPPSFAWTQRPVATSGSSFTEPSIAISPDGATTVVSAPGGGGVQYWVTKDGGLTFTHTATSGGGGDSELDFLPDGTLLSADLAITDSVIRWSSDGGVTWPAANRTTAGGEQDRQWLAHWGNHDQYLVYHGIAEEMEWFVHSADEGKTWSDPTLVNSPDQAAGMPNPVAKPGDTASFADQGYNTFQGPMLVNQDTGELYVIYGVSSAQDNATSVGGFGPGRGIVVAYSKDHGQTWTNRYAVVDPGIPTQGTIDGAIFPWGTLGPDGTLYVFYNGGTNGHLHTYYTWSKDDGASWNGPVKVDTLAAQKGATVYVTGAAGAPGVIDMAWMQSDDAASPDDHGAHWQVDFAQVRDANTDHPTVFNSQISDHVIHVGSICQKGILCVSKTGDDRSLGDFFELAIGPDGMAQVAWADNGPRPTHDRHVYWAKQTDGPGAFSPAYGLTKH